jgi:hypothetical protein
MHIAEVGFKVQSMAEAAGRINRPSSLSPYCRITASLLATDLGGGSE